MRFSRVKEIERLFDQGDIPGPEELAGEHYVVVPWFPWLSLEVFKHRKSVQTPDQGDNVAAGFHFGRFTLRKEEEWLLIDYDNEQNPRVLRGVIDRIRRVSDGRLIGKLYYRVMGREFFVMYFEMRPA